MKRYKTIQYITVERFNTDVPKKSRSKIGCQVLEISIDSGLKPVEIYRWLLSKGSRTNEGQRQAVYSALVR